jgi:hypothetical protein
MKICFARFKARLSGFSDGQKNIFENIASDVAKTAFSNQVVYEGNNSASFPNGKEVRE